MSPQDYALALRYPLIAAVASSLSVGSTELACTSCRSTSLERYAGVCQAFLERVFKISLLQCWHRRRPIPSNRRDGRAACSRSWRYSAARVFRGSSFVWDVSVSAIHIVENQQRLLKRFRTDRDRALEGMAQNVATKEQQPDERAAIKPAMTGVRAWDVPCRLRSSRSR